MPYCGIARRPNRWIHAGMVTAHTEGARHTSTQNQRLHVSVVIFVLQNRTSWSVQPWSAPQSVAPRAVLCLIRTQGPPGPEVTRERAHPDGREVRTARHWRTCKVSGSSNASTGSKDPKNKAFH